jgi:uncharacterized protein (TIGR00290 family)
MGLKGILAWSGGKDSAMALHEVRRAGLYTIERLLTTVTADYDRVCMHGVRTALLERQAAALGLPLDKIYLAANESQEGCDAKMQAYLARCRQQGTETVVFGDLFLEEVRQYRERNLSRVDMRAVFPLWQKDTKALAQAFIQTGFQAIITCVDLNALAPAFAGRDYDAAFLADLPAAVDPCGERGEFHSFVYGGPLFRAPISFTRGCTIVREERFAYLDLVPAFAEMTPQEI